MSDFLTTRSTSRLHAGVVLVGIIGAFMARAAHAQQPIQVRVTKGLSLGTVFRAGESSIDYYSNNAAVFTISGEPGRDVQILVNATGFMQSSSSSERNGISLVIPPESCAFSVDNGNTWTAFRPNVSWQEARFPTVSASPASIVVRVGGRMSAAADQHRGNYSGAITLTAIYK
jgi:hypothetical protein